MELTLETLLLKARAMTPADRLAAMKSLMMDERTPALLALLLSDREDYIQAASAQGNATHHGVQAHAMGSIYALDAFVSSLAAFLPKPAKRRPRTDGNGES